MSAGGDFGNPLRKFKLVFLGEQSGESPPGPARSGSPSGSGDGAGASLPPCGGILRGSLSSSPSGGCLDYAVTPRYEGKRGSPAPSPPLSVGRGAAGPRGWGGVCLWAFASPLQGLLCRVVAAPSVTGRDRAWFGWGLKKTTPPNPNGHISRNSC